MMTPEQHGGNGTNSGAAAHVHPPGPAIDAAGFPAGPHAVPPGAATGPGYPPPFVRAAPAGPRRPRKLWYGVGAALSVLGIVGGVSVFLAVVLATVHRASPPDEHTFGSNATTTVHLDAGASKTIYVTPTDTHGDISCTARGGSALHPPEMNSYRSDLTVNDWRAVFTLTAHSSADYTVSCTGPAAARYGVGEHVSMIDFLYPFIAAGLGVALFGVGIVVVIVTAVRRHRSAPSRVPYPPPWGGPPYPPPWVGPPRSI